MGSAACYHLAKEGHSVLGLEQFGIVHSRGSHAGQTRIIRKAYFEHPDYVPLLERAYDNWRALESETGEKLFYTPGVLYLGDSKDTVIKGVSSSANLYKIPIQLLDNQSLQQLYPQFRLPSPFQGILEPDAGFLLPEKAIHEYVKSARQKGATINENEIVLDWNYKGSTIVLNTNRATYETGRIIFTAGAWTAYLLKALKSKLVVTRQLLAWIKPKEHLIFHSDRMPCWFISNTEGGSYYGFPDLSDTGIPGPQGIKLALHYPGVQVSPDDIDFEIDAKEISRLQNFASEFLPTAGIEITDTKTCLYTNTPDEDFIVDFIPGTDRRVVVAGGFSGHGFKFAPVIGEVLAQLAITGKTEWPVDFLHLSRF